MLHPAPLSRRSLLTGSFPAPAAAHPAGTGQLIVVFLRGGMDGLSAVMPPSDAAYHDNRPTIGVPEEAAIPLDATFGMHPALAPLEGLYRDGRVAFVHACGNPAGSRSHFDAQDLMEQGGASRRADGSGWLARYLATTVGGSPFRAVARSANVPGSLRGSTSLAIAGLGTFGLGGRSGVTTTWDTGLRLAYAGDAPIDRVGTDTLDAIAAVDGIGATNPEATAFDDAVALLGAGLGVEIVTIDLGGWDTHDTMGTHAEGTMTDLLGGLGGALAGLQAALDARGMGHVTTVVMSEFGRRLAQNGSGGTDHGDGEVMVAMGGRVRGGRVIADWPGLAPDQLERGDLRVTTDYRDVLWELVRDVLGHPDPAAVFESHTPTPVALTT